MRGRRSLASPAFDAKISVADADHQRVLRNRNPNVFQRSRASTLSRALREFEATIEIGTLSAIDGQLPHRALKLVQEWAMIHREELLLNWLLCREKTAPAKVEPLP